MVCSAPEGNRLAPNNFIGTVYRLWEMGELERSKNPKHDFGLRLWQHQTKCMYLYRITIFSRASNLNILKSTK